MVLLVKLVGIVVLWMVLVAAATTWLPPALSIAASCGIGAVAGWVGMGVVLEERSK